MLSPCQAFNKLPAVCYNNGRFTYSPKDFLRSLNEFWYDSSSTIGAPSATPPLRNWAPIFLSTRFEDWGIIQCPVPRFIGEFATTKMAYQDLRFAQCLACTTCLIRANYPKPRFKAAQDSRTSWWGHAGGACIFAVPGDSYVTISKALNLSNSLHRSWQLCERHIQSRMGCSQQCSGQYVRKRQRHRRTNSSRMGSNKGKRGVALLVTTTF